MVYGIGSESTGYIGKLKEMGIKVLYNADYLENDPLGKAEWIRMIGALYCKEEMADSIFNTIESKYNSSSHISVQIQVKDLKFCLVFHSGIPGIFLPGIHIFHNL